MTQFQENILMLVKTISYYKGKTTKELINIPDCWLVNYSKYAVDRWMHYGVQMGWIRDKVNKNGDLIYYSTDKGLKQYNKNFSE